MLLGDNPRLVYGRMTGWGQTGSYAAVAGHDINYIALSGVLGAIGRAGEKPVPPINLVGDFGGGAMMLAFGMVSGLLAVKNGAPGQVIDCAMTDGSALLMAMMWGFRASGIWTDERGTNMLDSGAPFYDTYETADGGFVAIGSIEPQFYALLRYKLGLTDDPLFDAQFDRAQWPAQKARLTAIFKTKTRERMVRANGRHRRLLRAGAVDGRGRRPSAQRCPRHVRRDRRRDAARAGATLLVMKEWRARQDSNLQLQA